MIINLKQSMKRLSSAVEVKKLINDNLLIEIEAIAVAN